MTHQPSSAVPPIAIGGVGGSGTRLVADICRRLGFYVGSDLNPATDNLWFTLLFKRRELWKAAHTTPEFAIAADTFRTAMVGGTPIDASRVRWLRGIAATDRPQHPATWLNERVDSLIASTRASNQRVGPWGWKEPNTHIVLDRLDPAFPGLRYIHVVRNGLDMAHSTNQNQLEFWGPLVLGTTVPLSGPRASLSYWCAVHRRILQVGAAMQGRFMWLDYDALCAAPLDHLGTLLTFLGVAADLATLNDLVPLVQAADSAGRFRRHGLHVFDATDVAYVESLGFDVAEG